MGSAYKYRRVGRQHTYIPWLEYIYAANLSLNNRNGTIIILYGVPDASTPYIIVGIFISQLAPLKRWFLVELQYPKILVELM